MGVSEQFYNAILDAGCLVQTCGTCGKIHFATENPGHFEEKELEQLLDKQLKYPESYIQHTDSDTIHCGQFNGKIVVYQCCEKELEVYENWIWNHRFTIKKYIETRSTLELEAAQRDAEVLRGGK